MSRCFFASFAPEGLRRCDGRLQKCHLIGQQRIKRELAPKRTHLMSDRELAEAKRYLAAALRDPRAWVHGCVRHHQLFDNGRIPVPRSAFDEVEAFAVEHGLEWSLDRQFGLPEDVGAAHLSVVAEPGEGAAE